MVKSTKLTINKAPEIELTQFQKEMKNHLSRFDLDEKDNDERCNQLLSDISNTLDFAYNCFSEGLGKPDEETIGLLIKFQYYLFKVKAINSIEPLLLNVLSTKDECEKAFKQISRFGLFIASTHDGELNMDVPVRTLWTIQGIFDADDFTIEKGGNI